MNQAMTDIASLHDRKLAKVYVTVTAEALVFEGAIACMIFYWLGFSAFTLLQVIGTALLILVIGSVSLQIRKKHIKNSILSSLSELEISETDFKEFLGSHPAQFEFIQALFTSSKSLKNSIPPND